MENITVLLTPLITGVCTIAGAVFGAKLTKSAELDRQKKDRVIAAYVDFLSAAFLASQKLDTSRGSAVASLAISVSKIHLLGTKKAFDLASKIADGLIQNPGDPERLGLLINAFIQAVKQEIIM